MMKTIKFDSKLVPLIKKGTKTLTYRFGSKFNSVKTGESLLAADNAGKPFAEIKILNKTFSRFKRLPLNSRGHEVYKSKQDQRKTFTKYYGREIKDNERVIVLSFKVNEIA